MTNNQTREQVEKILIDHGLRSDTLLLEQILTILEPEQVDVEKIRKAFNYKRITSIGEGGFHDPKGWKFDLDVVWDFFFPYLTNKTDTKILQEFVEWLEKDMVKDGTRENIIYGIKELFEQFIAERKK